MTQTEHWASKEGWPVYSEADPDVLEDGLGDGLAGRPREGRAGGPDALNARCEGDRDVEGRIDGIAGSEDAEEDGPLLNPLLEDET